MNNIWKEEKKQSFEKKKKEAVVCNELEPE